MPPTRRSDLWNKLSGMGIFEERYFNINRKLLMCLGLWLYEREMAKVIFRTNIIILITFLMIPQLISISVHYKNMDRLMLSTFCFLTLAVMIFKVIGMILAEENMRQLHRSIASNWQRIEDDRERTILHKYSEGARTMTIVYIALMVSSAVTATAVPLIPKVLDFLNPLENPRADMYILEGEFFIDRETHFLPIFISDSMTVLLTALVVAAVDAMYIVSVEHCCALYAIIRYRLFELREVVQQVSSESEGVDSYEWLRRTIQLHRDALSFTSLLNDSFSTTFLFVLTAALVIIPLESCAVIANLDDPLHLFPYAVYFAAIIIHGFFLCYPGQRIIDHQLGLLDAAYCGDWYATPLRTKKLLLIFMLRCSEPVIITGGGILPINFEVYFSMLKTSVSYITVASSFR